MNNSQIISYKKLYLKLVKVFSICLIILYPQFSVVAQSNQTNEQLVKVKSAVPNFFVSPTGSDNNSGTSPAAAWRTLQKVNSTAFGAGAVIAFERGGSWYGQLVVPSSNITITAYGSGNKPIIHGWATLTGWTTAANGNFSVSNQSLLNRVRILTIDDRIYNMGRFPKNEWLKTHSASDGMEWGSVTSNNLTGTPNFNGGQIVLNKNSWVIDVGDITNHSGGTISYSGTSAHYRAQVHHGFFIQNHINTLTQFGDWMFNGPARRLTMHFGPQNPVNYIVRASSIDDVVVINGRSNVTIENLSIQGSNRTAVRLIGSGARNIIIRGCDFLKNGNDGVFMDGTGGNPEGLMVENSLFEDTKNRAIETHESIGATIRNNVFKRTYLDPGGGHNGDFSGTAISLGANGFRNGNFTVIGNEIYDSGYIAIRFSGSNVVIEKNIIHRYNLTKIDGGAIYCYGRGQSSVPDDTHVNRAIRQNIISNPNYTIPIPTQWGNEQGYGIYFDDRTRYVICELNTLLGNSAGIYIHNSRDLVVRNNLIYLSRSVGVAFVDDGIAGPPDGDIANIFFQDNIIYSLGSSRVLGVHNQFSPDIELGTLDNNFYIKPTGTIYVEKHQNWTNYERMTLQQWRDKYGYDLNTRPTPTTSAISEVFTNPYVNSNLTVDVGRNRIDIYGNPITNSIITLLPFESILVLESIMVNTNDAIKLSSSPQGEYVLIITPNPSDGMFYLNLEVEAKVEICNISGQMLQKRHLPNGREPIDLTEMPSGIYFLVVRAMETVFTKKIVIN